jgi:hypothetical protein
VERLRALAGAVLDWEALVAAAGQARLASTLFDAVHAAGVDGAVPSPLLARLRDEAALVASRNATFLRVAERACTLLAAGGFEPLVLKGTALSLHAPAWFSVRHQSDVDLLLPRAQVRAGGRLLLEAGFRPIPEAGGTLGYDGRSPFDETSALSHHHLPGIASAEGVNLELHHALPGHLAPAAERAIREDVLTGPRGLRTHGREALLGLLCAHVHVEHEREPSFLLRHVGDVVALRSAGASAERAQAGFGAVVERSLRLVEEARRAVARPGRWNHGLAEAALASGQWSPRTQLADWRAAFRGRWHVLAQDWWHGLFPSPRFMAQRYGVGLHSPLLPLTYPWRLLSALWRSLLGR